MTMRQQAQRLAMEKGMEVVTVRSHRQVKRLGYLYATVEWYGPVNLGSKSRLYLVAGKRQDDPKPIGATP